jgi:monoamine oxidase
MSEHADVVVVGAGMAGLTAARLLAEAGRRVVVLEARDRVGGRICTLHPDGADLPVELGAEFVHGRAPELWNLIEEAGLPTFEMDGKIACFEDGRIQDCNPGAAFEVLDNLPGEDAPDQPFADWIRTEDVSPEIAERVTSYVEGFNAADARRIGIAALAKQQKAEEEIEGARGFRIVQGYDALPAFLAKKLEGAGGRVLLRAVVRAIRWRKNSVVVSVYDASQQELQISASAVVVALPLGVMQARAVTIAPEPERAFAAIDQMAMGAALRITFVLRERPWAEAGRDDLSFLFAHGLVPRTWWATAPHASNLLTGWKAGPPARIFPAQAGPESYAMEAMRTLETIFGMDETTTRQMIISWHAHDWQADPFSLGAYSYAPAGALHASEILAQPVEDTVFFAGEHTDTTGHWGTVHAAVRSGMRAAEQVLSALVSTR